MDFKQQFEQSWQVLAGNFAPILVNTLVMLAVSVVSLGLLAPVVTAGYMQSLLLVLREERKPDIKDLFAHMNLFFPLLGFSVLFVIAVCIGMLMLVLPGIAVLLAGTFFLTYMLPLMTDQQMGLIEAIKTSSSMALEKPANEHFAVVAVLIILNSIGSSVVFGTVVTYPYSCLFVLAAYEEKRQRQLTGPKTNLSKE
ncbi:MAG: hypothetical protein ACL93V_13630 [Candidatus Electrothrix sp. YB6]